jgi:hypothetical protein
MGMVEEWVPDIDTMTCRNSKREIIIFFQKQGQGKAEGDDKMPGKPVKGLFCTRSIGSITEKTLKEAEDVFLAAYYENEEIGTRQ